MSLFTASYAGPFERIVSLAPSTTEILFAAGLGDSIVGVTTFCDYPEAAKSKPKIGGMSNPSLEAVVSLRPDIVIMTTDGNPREFLHKLRSLKIKTYVFKSLTIPELPDEIRAMGAALNDEATFEELANKIAHSIDRVKKDLQQKRKKILFIVWPEPLIAAGPETAVDDAITLLGGINIAGSAKGRYPKYSMEEIIRHSPDVIFIGKGEGMKEISTGLLKRIGNVPAVKKGNVFYVSDRLFRLGPRVIEGIEELAGYLKSSR